MDAARPHDRLVAVRLDERTFGRGTPEQQRERRIAVHDLVESAAVLIPDHHGHGPYRLDLSLQAGKLAFHLRTQDDEPVVTHLLSLTPFRTILRDYLTLCDSHGAAMAGARRDRIEALDAGRRSLHDQAAELLADRLRGKITADFGTMRRLFTLITALHWTR